ncbi:MAG: hypothetical protein R3B54_19075 [Bdellovibrionota bacterium]
MAPRNLKVEIQKEIQKVANSKFLKEFSKQLNGYEKKVRDVVRDFNLRSQEARSKSKKQMDQFTKRLNKTRKDVEKTLKSLINEESRLLNKSFNELVSHLKELSEQESAKKAPKKKAATKKKSAPKKKRLQTLKNLHESHKEEASEKGVGASSTEEAAPSPVQ